MPSFKTYLVMFLVVGLMGVSWMVGYLVDEGDGKSSDLAVYWNPPDSTSIPDNAYGELIRYGRDLVVNTSFYLGPKGKVDSISNGMNCQNCHQDAGTKFWGNNFGGVFANYPKWRDRSGSKENIYKRVNDCMERSLNGVALDTMSREMQAMQAYIKWVGRNVPAKKMPVGSGIVDLPFLDRAADPVKGEQVFKVKCQSCHTADGSGQLKADGSGYVYPPLWGENSYNTGAGLYRISRLAGYIKDNMPFGSSHDAPALTDKEAWDVAAFISSQPRPSKTFPKDWPNISKKPIDHPFGPFSDTFSEAQHKYGPFKPIKRAHQ